MKGSRGDLKRQIRHRPGPEQDTKRLRNTWREVSDTGQTESTRELYQKKNTYTWARAIAKKDFDYHGYQRGGLRRSVRGVGRHPQTVVGTDLYIHGAGITTAVQYTMDEESHRIVTPRSISTDGQARVVDLTRNLTTSAAPKMELDDNVGLDICIPVDGLDPRGKSDAHQRKRNGSSMEGVQERQVWPTSRGEMDLRSPALSSRRSTSTVPDMPIQSNPEAIETGPTHKPLSTKGSMHVVGTARVHTGSDSHVDGALEGCGEPKQCPPIHRSVAKSAGIDATAQDVFDTLEEYLRGLKQARFCSSIEPVLAEGSSPYPIRLLDTTLFPEALMLHWFEEHEDYYYPTDDRVLTFNDGTNAIPMKRQHCYLPLAPISSSRLSYDAFFNLKITPDEQLIRWWSWIRSPILLSFRENGMEKGQRITNVSRTIGDELHSLLAAGVISKARSHVSMNSYLFKVRKKEDSSRLIVDCRGINAKLPKPGPMGLPSIRDVIDNILQFDYFVQFDAKNFFYQFSLENGADQVFIAGIGNKRGAFSKVSLNVLPMGFRYAPAIAQQTANLLVQNVLSTCGGYGTAWIDNFIFAAKDRQHCERMRRTFIEICKTVNLELKEIGDVTQSGEFLGIHVDLMNGVIHPAEAMQQSLSDACSVGKTWTPRTVARIVGKCMWPLYSVARTPLAKFTKTLIMLSSIGKFMAQNGSWDASFTLGPTCEEALQSMCTEAKQASFARDMAARNQKTWVWTDASNNGAGIIHEHSQARIAWSFARSEQHIFDAELITAVEGVVAAFTQSDEVTIIVDNTAAYGALVRGHSKSLRANLALEALASARTRDQQLYVGWVPTVLQRADALSRHLHHIPDRFGTPFCKRAQWIGSGG